MLSGFSAAELPGASCGPKHAPAEITVPGPGRRAHPGLLVHRVALAPGEIRRCGGVRVTTAVRTGWDLARRGDLVEAVVALDTLARVGRFHPDLLLNFLTHYPRARGAGAVPDVLALADRRSGSPMETRLRLLLIRAGLPRPQVQWVVQFPGTRGSRVARPRLPRTRLAPLPLHQDGDLRRAGAILSEVRRALVRAA